MNDFALGHKAMTKFDGYNRAKKSAMVVARSVRQAADQKQMDSIN